VSGYATPTRISKFQQSRRLEDNSDYQNKLDFEEATERSTTLETTRQDIYALA
jgi:hypothetical protein